LLHDGPARERLREAQQREAAAVAAVFAAQGALQKACAKRDSVLASASEVVDAAQDVVAAKQAALVKVSGVDRAALLLGLAVPELRKALNRTGPPADR
jgi:hypothetical protein